MESTELLRQQLERETAARQRLEEQLENKEQELAGAYRAIRGLQASAPLPAQGLLWKLALEASGDGVWEYDVRTGETAYLPQFKKMLGYAEDATFNGDTWRSVVHPDDYKGLKAAFWAYLEGRTPRLVLEHRLRCLDGGYQYFLIRGLAVERDEQGKPLRVVGTILDINRQKQLELELKDTANRLSALIGNLRINEKRYRDLYNYSQALICTHDLEGTLLAVNPSITKLLGYTQEELVGMPLTAFLPPYDVEKFRPDYLDKVVRDGEAKGIFRVLGKGGRPLFLLYQNYKVEEGDAEPYIIGFSQDVTERIKAEKELRLAQRMTEDLARAKELFLANMSHEIRTPLNGILGIATLLSKTELDEEQQKYLSLITDSANNLLVIVNDILEIEKIASGKFAFEQIPFRVADKIIATVQPFRFKAEEKQLRLELRNELPDGLVVTGDPHRLAQVLNNFLSNALKFTGQGTITVSARLAAQTDTTTAITFSVADTGIGISADRLSDIFDPFVQAATDTARKYGGTGLGLSICKSMIELQDGSIQVDSAEGRGTTFTFTIPYAKGAMPLQPEKQEETGFEGLERRRMLVAEDVPVNQFFLKHILESWGVQVDVVDNGREAVARVQARDYDLVLMDIQMPEMDGTAATQAIRQLPEKHKAAVPVIALTANALRGDNQRYLDAGMNGYVSKPYTAEKLYNAIGGLLLPAPGAGDAGTPAAGGEGELLYDLSMIRAVSRGNEDFVKEIVTLFLEALPADLAQLLEAGRQAAWEQLARTAHKMKSAIDNMGIHSLVPVIRRLEHNAVAQEHLQDIPLLTGQVNDTLQQVFVQLKAMLAAKPENTGRL